MMIGMMIDVNDDNRDYDEDNDDDDGYDVAGEYEEEPDWPFGV